MKKEMTGKKKAEARDKANSRTFPVAGIGSSAGGLEALETFCSRMTPGSGLTQTQAEDPARYSFIPRSAMNTGQVDYVLPVEEMPEARLKDSRPPCLRGKAPIPAQAVSACGTEDPEAHRTATRHDFTPYKAAIVRRQNRDLIPGRGAL